MVATSATSSFHLPGDDDDTEEQIAYQKEMLNRYYFGHEDAGSLASDEGNTPDRGMGTSSSTTSGGIMHRIKGFVKDIEPTVQATINFFSLESRLTKEIDDPIRFPEVAKQANVRRGTELCQEELSYIVARKAGICEQFAKYMCVDPVDVHPDDIPTIAFGGSGGGYRAMLAFLGYSLATKEAGLWDLLTYVAGVSGSCWAIAAYYTFGGADVARIIEHCKKRLSPHHPLSPDAIQMLLASSRGGYETLGPLIQKRLSGLHAVPMDLYAVFTTGYLFMQPDPLLQPLGSAESEISGSHRAWWKWTSATKHLTSGAEPLPILTAIRHERPWKDWVDQTHPFADANPKSAEHQQAAGAWWQWFEITPYEIGCDELQAWCPTWGFGRPFSLGRSIKALPEQSLALLLGLCTSAPAGPLSSYLATIQRNLPRNMLGKSVNMLAEGVAKMWGKQGTEVFTNHHPLHASNEYNFLYHYTDVPKAEARPKGIENSPRVHLLDSGMDNNCPTYVMLHPGRKVDLILNMDASSDVQKDTFPQRVNQIGFRRGLSLQRRQPDLKPDPDLTNPDRTVPQIYDGACNARPETVVDAYGETVTNPPAPSVTQDSTMVYLPLLPNERAVPGYDPSTAEFSGSYNLVWTPEQVEMIVKTSVANFKAGEATIKEAIRDAWSKKKKLREKVT